MKKPTKKFYSVSETAKYLGISRAGVNKAIQEKRLKAIWGTFTVITEGWRISATEMKKFQVSELHQDAGKKMSDG